MKIPRTTENVEIELRCGPRSSSAFDYSIALVVTAKVNDQRISVVETMRPEYLDQEGFGKSLFEKIAREVGRKVMFG